MGRITPFLIKSGIAAAAVTCSLVFTPAVLPPGPKDSPACDAADEGAAVISVVDRYDPQHELISMRIAARDGVADAVLTGQTSLSEAAAEFHHINAVGYQLPLLGVPGATPMEQACHQVISYVEARDTSALPGGEENRQAVIARLRDELECMRLAGEFSPPDSAP